MQLRVNTPINYSGKHAAATYTVTGWRRQKPLVCLGPKPDLDNGKQIDVVIIDLSNAFDTVPLQETLGEIWSSSGSKGTCNGERSDEDVLSRVPQGNVLGPLLFLLHNDLPHVLHPDTRCGMFADD